MFFSFNSSRPSNDILQLSDAQHLFLDKIIFAFSALSVTINNEAIRK